MSDLICLSRTCKRFHKTVDTSPFYVALRTAFPKDILFEMYSGDSLCDYLVESKDDRLIKAILVKFCCPGRSVYFEIARENRVELIAWFLDTWNGHRRSFELYCMALGAARAANISLLDRLLSFSVNSTAFPNMSDGRMGDIYVEACNSGDVSIAQHVLDLGDRILERYFCYVLENCDEKFHDMTRLALQVIVLPAVF